ncbi:MAG: glycogen debranching enzyme family protein [Phycisphaeraceae bacterium]|nr:glycogen debranching enzyme family protein [Phycisphaeraceae bacterium]
MPPTMTPAAPAGRARIADAAAGPAAKFAFSGTAGLAALRGQEWVLSNGLGGFAMGTAAGVPTRRYHALLTASRRPPVARVSALNALVERAEVEGFGAVEFSSFEFNAGTPVVHPDGCSRLMTFECDESCRWRWADERAGIELSRELVMFRGVNAVGVRYTLRRSAISRGRAVRLTVRPLVSLRDFHSLIRRAWADSFLIRAGASGVEVAREGVRLSIELAAGAARFAEDAQWWYDFSYAQDADRGQDCVEDLFSPGAFEIELALGVGEAHADLVAWVDDPDSGHGGRPHHSIDEELAEQRRRGASLAAAVAAGCEPGDAGTLGVLARAADAFIVARTDAAGARSGVSTIAGYPWFSDWGRDAFVSLPGLLLSAGRHEEALRQLAAFARARRRGIIPNVFDDRTGEPEYNTVDASLWFVHAACAWLAMTDDCTAFDRELRDACADVVKWYKQGTDHNIAMDPIDRLIAAGTSATQLTWMDARRDGVTFTPRFGKAVEINALWYNALRSLAAAVAPDDAAEAANLNDLADAVRKSFVAAFWNERAGALHDCLVPDDNGKWTPDPTIRPNQIFAAGLPHCMLDARRRRAIIDTVKARLLTPMGVRTLDPADPRYRGRYRGTLFDRDAAYHQGTAWPWLLGPLAEAVLRDGEFGAAARREARQILGPVLRTLDPVDAQPREGTCPGQIAEVYDGDDVPDAPQRAGGCPAQAWSVAETLRVLAMISRPSSGRS